MSLVVVGQKVIMYLNRCSVKIILNSFVIVNELLA